MHHHTKDKGDIGLGHVMADLLANGIQPAILISEHLPFDCIAVSGAGRLSRLSVKYRKAQKNGAIEVSLSSFWADRNGTHTHRPNRELFDAVAVYCPDTGLVYYVRSDEFIGVADSFVLRLNPPKNGQKNGIRLAAEHVGAARLFI